MDKCVVLVLLPIMVFFVSCSDDSTTVSCSSYSNLQVQYKVVDTGQEQCFDRNGQTITCVLEGQDYYGQDAQYSSNAPNFVVCDNSVVVDQNTGLMWQKAHNDRTNYTDAVNACTNLELGGFSDWRLPDIKEAFSIINFAGTIDDTSSTSPSNPYVFKDYFDIAYDPNVELSGSHQIQMMGQTWTSTTRPDDPRVNYFYNFLDGHLKSRPTGDPDGKIFYRCVRGEQNLTNNFTNNGDGTVTDSNTGLMWQTSNAEERVGDYQFTWKEALEYCENLTLAGHSDWRLPDVKSLQSIVDYTDATNSIDTSVFTHTTVANTGPFFWSSTTFEEQSPHAVYMCFGHCWNYLFSIDHHGPGAQRSDNKYDNGNLPATLGDQLDLVQVDNYVRCVRTVE